MIIVIIEAHSENLEGMSWLEIKSKNIPPAKIKWSLNSTMSTVIEQGWVSNVDMWIKVHVIVYTVGLHVNPTGMKPTHGYTDTSPFIGCTGSPFRDDIVTTSLLKTLYVSRGWPFRCDKRTLKWPVCLINKKCESFKVMANAAFISVVNDQCFDLNRGVTADHFGLYPHNFKFDPLAPRYIFCHFYSPRGVNCCRNSLLGVNKNDNFIKY